MLTGGCRLLRPGLRLLQHRGHGVITELAVGLELRFVEPLVRRGLVRKIRMHAGVLHDVDRFVAGQRRLDVQQKPRHRFRVGLLIMDAADAAVIQALAGALRGNACLGVDVDAHAEIHLAFAHRVAEVLEAELRVHAGIDRDDEPAAAPHQFVDAEILEVAAVAQIDELGVLVGEPEDFAQQIPQAEPGAGRAPRSGLRRVLHPPAQADVEHSQ